MRPFVVLLLWSGCMLLAVTEVNSAQAVVRLNLVIPDGHKVTDVHLRFERTQDKTEGSFEGAENDEDDVDEGPSLGKGPANAHVPGKAGATSGRQSNTVETFSGSPKKPGEEHNTIERLIRLPRRKNNVVNIRK